MVYRDSANDQEAPNVSLLMKLDIELSEIEEAEDADGQLKPAAPAADMATAIERHRRSVLYWITFVSMGLMVGSVGPLLPILYADVGQSIEEVGGARTRGQLVPVFVARGAGGLAGSLFSGAVLEWAPERAHRALAAGVFLAAAGAAAMAHGSRRVWHLAAAFAALDLGCGLTQVRPHVSLTERGRVSGRERSRRRESSRQSAEGRTEDGRREGRQRSGRVGAPREGGRIMETE
jgi:hypothetical protein